MLNTSVSQQSVLVIDDVPLRKQSFRSAEKIIRKIDRMQSYLRLFQQKDQKLFGEWVELTFRSEREQISRLQSVFRELSSFHNWVVATADLLHVPLHEAFKIMRQEQHEYAVGSEAQRERIEHEREQRERYLEEETLRQAQVQKGGLKARRPSDFEEEAFKRLWKMDDQALSEICQDDEVAFELLSLSLRLSEAPEDYELFLRIWDCVPEYYQQEFGEAFEHKFKAPMAETIAQVRETFEKSKCDFVQKEKVADLAPSDEERLKILYRKLVRQLHPDTQNDVAQAHWLRSFWERVQQAYKQRQLGEMETLLRLTLLRQKQLHHLTISEIVESCRWLEQELEQLRGETKNLRRLPAWGFSRGKDLESLSKTMRQNYLRDLQSLQTRINSLKAQHARLERMAAIG